MKIENLDEAKACAEAWESLLKLETAIRSPKNQIESLSFGRSQALAFNLISLGNVGITHNEIEQAVIDILDVMLDKRATYYLQRMQALGVDIHELAVAREAMIRELDATPPVESSNG